MDKDYLFKDKESNKYILYKLFNDYFITFKESVNISTIHIIGNLDLENKLILILRSAIKNNKKLQNKDIEKFYPISKNIII